MIKYFRPPDDVFEQLMSLSGMSCHDIYYARRFRWTVSSRSSKLPHCVSPYRAFSSMLPDCIICTPSRIWDLYTIDAICIRTGLSTRRVYVVAAQLRPLVSRDIAVEEAGALC